MMERDRGDRGGWPSSVAQSGTRASSSRKTARYLMSGRSAGIALVIASSDPLPRVDGSASDVTEGLPANVGLAGSTWPVLGMTAFTLRQAARSLASARRGCAVVPMEGGCRWP